MTTFRAVFYSFATLLLWGQNCFAAADHSDRRATAIYTNCAGCHGAQGEGSDGPAFSGNATLQNADYVVWKILAGSQHMPSFTEQLPDAQIAAIASYIRSQWGNHFRPAVTVQQVQRMRLLLAR
ncbi:MAG: cytochrome c [Steroidobacteraceae bacterium]